jgi:hypothetical protein
MNHLATGALDLLRAARDEAHDDALCQAQPLLLHDERTESDGRRLILTGVLLRRRCAQIAESERLRACGTGRPALRDAAAWPRVSTRRGSRQGAAVPDATSAPYRRMA